MRVLDITSAFSNSCGGIKRYYREKARVLPGLGVECHFAVPGELRSTEAFGDGTMHRLPGPPMPGNDAYRLFGLRAGIGELIQRLQPDVIEVASHYVLPGIVLRAARSAAKPPRVVGFFHSHPRQVVENVVQALPAPVGGDALAEGVWSFFRRQHSRYDATLVASPTLARELLDRGYPRVREVGLGVDVAVFTPEAPGASRAEPPTICYSGRFTVDKELPVLLAAFDRVHAATGARLLFVGDGPMRAQLEAFARSREAVTVRPYLDSPAEVARVLASCDVVVVSSRAETFSLSTAEAIACGTLVVGTAGGAVADLIEYTGAGRTFRAGDADSLGDALIGALSADAAARRAQGLAGRARLVERYTWAAVMQRLHDVYRDPALAPLRARR
ncbi:MAG: glycosyltransferase [Deltaproteobacteria bacterium]|nr:glycosyltransferase [Myxococcales bacterium]MDP3216877.1 glycosyltransferase [Deltaproteobacteria bacterium]